MEGGTHTYSSALLRIMIGQGYSSSRNACVIKFTGGLLDGEEGLYDHDRYDSISVCKDKKTWTYKRHSKNHYNLDNVLDWETNKVRVY